MNSETMRAYNGPNGERSFKFAVKRVTGITMATDGVTYANLKGFRQARISVTDYMELKERKAQPVRGLKTPASLTNSV